MFNNLSSLQRNFIRNCFIILGIVVWLVFGFVSVVNEWELCCLIFSSPFIFLVLFIIVMGIYKLINSKIFSKNLLTTLS